MPRTVQNGLGMGKGFAKLVSAEWLQEIVLDTARHEVPIQADIVDFTCCDHNGARLANLGERVDVVQRIARFRQVHKQDVGACRDRERLDRITQATFVDLFNRPAHFRANGANGVGGSIVADVR